MRCSIAIGTAIEYAKGTLNRFTKEWQRMMFGPSKDSQAVDDYIDNLKTKHSKEKYLADCRFYLKIHLLENPLSIMTLNGSTLLQRTIDMANVVDEMTDSQIAYRLDLLNRKPRNL